MDCAATDRFLQNTPDYRLSKDPKNANLLVFRGCAFNQEKEDLSCQIVKVLESIKRSDAQLLVSGCIAKIRPDLAGNNERFKNLVDQIDRLSRLEGEQDLTANSPYPEFWQIPDDVLSRKIRDDLTRKYCHRGPGASLLRGFPKLHGCLIGLLAKYRRLIDKEMLLSSKRTFCIKISTGCIGNCTYCSIRLARGRIRSKSIDAVVREFELGLDSGYKDFALVGTDVSDYGKDMGMDLMDLLKKLLAYQGTFTLRLRNVNPRWLIPSVSGFCELLKTGKIEYILSPVESGSNRILDRMNRGYHIEGYVEAVRKIRNACPSIFIKTQIMVGFPGETDGDFQKTRELLTTGLFDYVEVYAYSKRPGTKASSLLDEVDDKTITKRYRKLLWRYFFLLPLRRWLSVCKLKLMRPQQESRSLAKTHSI